MICQVCKKAEATVHLTQIVGGKVRKLDLCAACAEECGANDPIGFSIVEVLKKFADVFTPEPQEAPVVKQEDKEDTSLKCPACGYTDRELDKTGRLGCPLCYQALSEKIVSAINEIHENPCHVGKTPANPAPLSGGDSAAELTPSKPKRKRTSTRKKAVSSPLDESESAQKSLPAEKEPEQPERVRRKNTLPVLEKLLVSKEEDLQKAINTENYELAAKLRDEIQVIRKKVKESAP